MIYRSVFPILLVVSGISTGAHAAPSFWDMRGMNAQNEPNLAEIEKLVSEGADPNEPSKTGKGTPLLQATGFAQPHSTHSLEKSLEIRAQKDLVIKRLLTAGAKAEVQDDYGRTPLSELARSWAPTTQLEDLIKHGADVNKLGQYKIPPIAGAIGARNVQNVKTLMKYGAPLKSDKFKPLTLAVTCLDPSLWSGDKFELPEEQAKLDKFRSETAIEMIDFLLAQGEDINAVGPRSAMDQEMKATVLAEAVRGECPSNVIAHLLKKGANPYLEGDFGGSALKVLKQQIEFREQQIEFREKYSFDDKSKVDSLLRLKKIKQLFDENSTTPAVTVETHSE